jgi:O-succinylbenzoic acid--CoA ligase
VVQPQDIIRRWQTGDTAFDLQTSGTTGLPQNIRLKRHLIQLSCQLTGEFLHIQPTDCILCCLPLNRVGGLMQVFRSQIWNIPIHFLQASANPLNSEIPNASITSLTPMQAALALQSEVGLNNLRRFRIVLIGGGELSPDLENTLAAIGYTQFYHTYGMTETYSHIAMRKLGMEQHFEFLLPTQARTDNRGCLAINNELTENQWLQTNDLVQLLPDGRFTVLGRADNLINSGGVKINPAEVEAIIASCTGLQPHDFFCAGLPDSVLGQKLVLILLESASVPNLDQIPFSPAYLKPKEIIIKKEFIYTETQKIRRAETLNQR